MLSVNAAMQVDLFAQANASFVAGDSIRASVASPTSSRGRSTPPGGHAVAPYAWHDKTDTSTVVPGAAQPGHARSSTRPW